MSDDPEWDAFLRRHRRTVTRDPAYYFQRAIIAAAVGLLVGPLTALVLWWAGP